MFIKIYLKVTAKGTNTNNTVFSVLNVKLI